ncbi:DUF1127 domain-containing protein [Shimia sp.]|uniref:DUF1127 domain-containing protein n=1 Tax=Shimia sp. TaxID=1954381 RepID=UPI003B8B10A8
MALSATHTSTTFTLGKILAAPFVAIGNSFVHLMESNNRVREVEFLNSLSDEQLAGRGLKREDIVRHVFRDMMHL